MIQKTIHILVVLFITASTLYAQEIDSLFVAFSQAKKEDLRKTGNEIVLWLEKNGFSSKNDSVFSGNTLSDREYEMRLTDVAVRYLFRFEHYERTFEAAKKLTRLAEAAKDTACLIHAYYFMGFSCQRMGKMEEGLHYNQICYELCRKTEDDEMTSSVLNNMGNIYSVNGQDSMAVIYFLKTIDMERKLGRKQNLAIRLGNIATVYSKLGKYEKALSYVREGLELDKENGRPDKIAIRLHQMSEVYLAMKDYEKAKACELEAIDYFRQAKSTYGKAVVLNILGEIEIHLRQDQQAEEYFLEALENAEQISNNLLIQKCCDNLYSFYRNKNAALSLAYFERSIALKDSLFNEENRKQLNEFQIKYETAEKELEIERQENLIQQREMERKILFAGLAIVFIILILVIHNLRLRTRRTRELAEMNETKDKFFSIISHDLKNPALSQRQALQVLLDSAGHWEEASLRKYYEELLRSADGQVELLYHLLNWAQAQTSRMPYCPRSFDLVAELENELSLLNNMAKRKEIILNVETPETMLVTGDANMLLTIIRNLVTNAIKFSPVGEIVTLTIRKETNVKIIVADNGAGMSAEQIQNLFRIDIKRSLRGTLGEQGTGLGLVVCNELLAKHGSKLQVESQPGKGSRFEFELL